MKTMLKDFYFLGAAAYIQNLPTTNKKITYWMDSEETNQWYALAKLQELNFVKP